MGKFAVEHRRVLFEISMSVWRRMQAAASAMALLEGSYLPVGLEKIEFKMDQNEKPKNWFISAIEGAFLGGLHFGTESMCPHLWIDFGCVYGRELGNRNVQLEAVWNSSIHHVHGSVYEFYRIDKKEDILEEMNWINRRTDFLWREAIGETKLLYAQVFCKFCDGFVRCLVLQDLIDHLEKEHRVSVSMDGNSYSRGFLNTSIGEIPVIVKDERVLLGRRGENSS